MTNVLVSTALQLLVVGVLGFAVWFATSRRRERFGPWIGLRAITWPSALISASIGISASAALLTIPAIRELSAGGSTVVGKLSNDDGVMAVILLLITAIFKTSLTEELLFRGLIGKRLIARWGFATGNLIQASAFAAIHLLLLLDPTASRPATYLLVVFSGAMGWVNGWLNERMGEGSILPGWIAHGTANVVSYIFLFWVYF